MSSVFQDLQYAWRVIQSNPGFAAAAVLTLGLGIGANTAIFSVVNAVLLSPLGYHDPDRLVLVWMRFTEIGLPRDQNWVSAPEFRDLTTLNQSFSHVAALDDTSFNLSGDNRPERIEGARVSPALFSMLGVAPAQGRLFTEEHAVAGEDAVVVIGHGLWQRRFGADPGIVGRVVRLNGRPFTVLGVAPEGFAFPERAELWAPLAFRPEDLAPDERGSHGLMVLARIRPDRTIEQARADMQAVSQRIIEQNPGYPYRDFGFAVLLNPLLEETVGDVQSTLWLLMGAVGFVLLIACANIASLLLVHASARGSELAIRGALGADRFRLMRQLLGESVLLAALGGVLGLLVGYWGTQTLAGLAADTIPRIADARLDRRVLAFTTIVTLATGLFFGILPALQASAAVRFEQLRSGMRWSTADIAANRLRQGLVLAEVALSLVLLVGAGLLIRSFVKLLEVDGGFRTERVLTMLVSMSGPQYEAPERVRAFSRDVLDGIRTLPGVEHAGSTSGLPLSGSSASGTTTGETTAVPPDKASPEADWRAVMPGYFEALGIRLVRGRYFDARDNDRAAPVVIIDETMASTLWLRQNPIGRRLKRGGADSTDPWMTIVGVVRHVRHRTLESPSRVQLYWPQMQDPRPFLALVVRAAGDPRALAGAVEKQVQAVDPDQPVFRVRTMEELAASSLARRRLALLLVALLAGAAVLLAAIGIYGVMAYSVSQRTHEFGIRVALGADRLGILQLVLGRGMALAVAGCALGLATAFLMRRAIASLLYDINASDPVTIAAVLAVLLGVAFLACYLPARRATRVDPATTLRYE
jgi:predicted permease